MEFIVVDEMVMEYVGEVIRQFIVDICECRYEEMGIGLSYFFCVDQDIIIDVIIKGNLVCFINYCCDVSYIKFFCLVVLLELINLLKILLMLFLWVFFEFN